MVGTSLAFRILATDEGADKVLSSIGARAGNVETRLTLLSKASGQMGEATRGAFKMAAAAVIGGGLIEGLHSLWEEAQASALVTKQTEAVIKSTGGAAHVTADQVGDLATALSNKNAVDDEAIQSGMNLLLTFTNIRNEAGKGNDVFDQTTQAVIDMTAAMHGGVVTQEGLATSSIQVGKALNDPVKGITALTKVGVTFTAQQKEQIKAMVAAGDTLGAQKIILKELSKEFGGSAEAAATGAKRLGIEIGNIKEDIGKGLVTAVDNISNQLLTKLPSAMEGAGHAFSLIADPIQRIGHDLLDLGQKAGGLAANVIKPLAILAGGAIVGGLHLLADVLDFIDQHSGVFLPLAEGALAFFAASKGIGAIISGYKIFTTVLETVALKALYAKDAMIGLATGETVAKVAGVQMQAALGPLGLLVAGLSLAVGVLAFKHMGAKQAAEEHATAVANFSAVLRDNKGAINDVVLASRAQELEQKGLLELAGKIGLSLNDYTQATLGNVDAQHKVGDALKQAAENGSLTFEQFKQLSEGTGEYIQVTEDSITANQRLGQATTETASATSLHTQKVKEAALAAAAAKKADDDLWASLTRLTNVNLTAAGAHLAVQSAILAVDVSLKGLTGSTREQTRTLTVNTATGIAARQQLIGNIQAILADGEAQKARGKSTAQATATMQTDIAALRAHYIAAGYSKQAVDAIIGSLVRFGKQHPVATTKVETGQANGAIRTITRQLDMLNGRVVRVFINGEVSGIGPSVPNVGPKYAAHATGGLWSGWSWTGERGPELNYSAGTTATFTAEQSKQMVESFRAGGGGGGGGVNIGEVHVHVSGVTGRDAALEIARELNSLKRSGFAVSL